MGIIAGLLSMLGWGLSDFLGAVFSRKISYLLTIFWMQIAGFSFALIYFFINFSSLTSDITNILKFAPILAVCGFLNAAGYLAFFKVFKNGQISLVSPIGGSAILITVIFSLIFLNENPQSNQIMAIILIISGIVLISIDIKELFKIKKLNILPGVKEGLVAMFCWGILIFLLTIPSRTMGWFLTVFISRLFTVLFLFFAIIIKKQEFKVNLRPPFLILLLTAGLLDVISFFAYTIGIRGESVFIVAPIATSYPIITIILAKIFLKEKFVFNQILGIISVIAGLVLVS